MDRDTTAIGGIAEPLQPTRQLYHLTIILDLLGVVLSLFVSPWFTLGIILFILVSKAYSYRKTRLKKYPITGFLLVVLFQGISTFLVVYHGCSVNKTIDIPIIPAIIAGLLIGGFYPLTQIYQHQADKEDGVITISYLLGYRGTFIFSGLLYLTSFILIYCWFTNTGQLNNLLILFSAFVPVIVYFFVFAAKVWKNEAAANFRNTMRMTMVASLSTNIAFLIILINNHLE